MKRRHTYLIQPRHCERWIEIKRSALPELRQHMGKHRVRIHKQESERTVTHFVEITPE